MKKIIITAIVSVAALAGLAYWQSSANSDTQTSDNTKKVAATIFPVYDITREIAGDEFEVVLMLPVGASPHTFDPQPSLLKDLEGSETVFSIGNGLDSWSESLTESIGAEAVTVDAGVDLRETAEDSHDEHEEEGHTDEDDHEGESGHDDEGEDHEDEDKHSDGEEDEHTEEGHDDDHEDEGHEDEHGHAHGPIDPHYWLSIHGAEQIAMNIAAELGELDSENANLFIERAEAYAMELETLETELEEKTATLMNRNVISLHDAWEYFAADFDLNIVGTFEPAAGEEPTPQYLANLQEEVEEHSVGTLFVEPQLSTASINAFAGDNDLGVAVIDPLGGVEGRDSYIELMRYNVDQVVSALN